MLMYKDGITREVEKHQIEMFKNLGFVEVKAEELKKDSEPEKETEDSKQSKRKKSEED